MARPVRPTMPADQLGGLGGRWAAAASLMARHGPAAVVLRIRSGT
jgi:hypothetical protein